MADAEIPGLKDKLLAACDTDDWREVMNSLEDNLDKDSTEYKQLIDVKFSEGVIKEMCLKGYSELVDVFIKNGFPIIESEHTFKTMLHFAISGHHLNLVKYLLSKHSDLNIHFCHNRKVDPILQHVVSTGCLDILKYLISVGVNVNDNKKETARKEVNDVSKGEEQTGLEYEKEYESLLDIAASKSHLEILRLLLESGCNPTGNTVYCAAKSGSIECVKLLMMFGVDIVHDNNAMYGAVSGNQIKMIQYILDCGMNINQYDEHYSTVLSLAAISSTPETVKFLIDKGAEVNVGTDIMGFSPLHYAVSSKHCFEIVKILLEAGACVNKRDDGNRTVLYSAIELGKFEIAELFLENGVDVNVVNINNLTVLDILLFDHICIFDGVMYNASNPNPEKVYKFIGTLVLYGADPHITYDNSDYNLLHWFAGRGAVELVKLLLQLGVDPSIKDSKGKTPCDYAKEKGHLDIVDCIMEYYFDKFI